MEFPDTLKRFMDDQNLKQADLCRVTGIPTSLMSNYMKGLKFPSLTNSIALSKALNVSIDALAGVDIKKDASSELPEEALKVAKDYTKLDERGRGAVKAILTYESGAVVAGEPEPKPQKVTPLPKAKRTRGGMVEIKVYDQPAAAGLGNYLDEPAHHLEQYPDGVAHPDTDFGVIISGDSMEPKIHDGGTVFVQSTPSIDPGKIGIFILNGQAYCKKLAVDHENRQVRLVSLNPDYEDIIIQDSDEMRTLGRVLGQWTKGHPNEDIFGW